MDGEQPDLGLFACLLVVQLDLELPGARGRELEGRRVARLDLDPRCLVVVAVEVQLAGLLGAISSVTSWPLQTSIASGSSSSRSTTPPARPTRRHSRRGGRPAGRSRPRWP